MNFDKALSGRRAVRDYTSEPIDQDLLRYLIDCAVMAPSAVNQQPWAFTVIRDQAVLDRISSEAKLHMISTMQGNRHAEQFLTHLEDPKFHIFYHAPALIVISAVEEGPWIVEDCSLAAENLMLSAFNKDLGSCWIGFAQSYLNTPTGKALIKIPETWIPIAPIIVGHTNSFPAPVERNKPVIQWLG
ncbi:nitroreductase [Oxalobacteraceae bacterium GrIS 2.11]